MSYKPQVKVINESKWHDNGLRFATMQEAEKSASDLFSRWTACTEHRGTESDDPVNQ